MSLFIKVCPDPQCEAVYHNCPEKHTRCNDCGGRVMKINKDTYESKFAGNWFQYDFTSMNYFRPVQPQLTLDI